LFTFIEEENKRLGYSYAQESEIQPYHQEEITENKYPGASETILRPLINYDHQPESIDPPAENNDNRMDNASSGSDVKSA
jgi:hypothetical protein